MGFAPEESRDALAEAGGKPEEALALLAQALIAQSAAASAHGETASAWNEVASISMRDSASPQAEVEDDEALRIEGVWTKVRGLRPGLKGVNLVVIVLEPVGKSIQTAQGNTVQTWLVADETGAVELALYDQHAHAFAEGAILRLLDGYRWVLRAQLRAQPAALRPQCSTLSPRLSALRLSPPLASAFSSCSTPLTSSTH